jgi:hypothetical protein
MKHFVKKLTDWAHWPFYLFYFPIAYAWPLYYLKSRSLWFFTSSNPTLAFGGFEGVAKQDMYKQLPSHLCPHSIFIKPSMSFDAVVKQVHTEGITYPFIVKPDVGMKGLLFRKIENESQLQTYHSCMPVDYIIQEFLDHPLEVSVFYYRKPGSSNGRITALIGKELFMVTGDGASTIAELVERHPEAKGLLPKVEKQFGPRLKEVLASGETFCISHIANLFNGARFYNLKNQISAELISVFDRICDANQFYYGRYDIKCRCVDDLKQGNGFYILEFNGAGSVPNHVFTGTYTLLEAYKEMLLHWRLLYEASTINHKNGHQHWSFLKGHHFLKRSRQHFNVLKKLDRELVLT